MKNLSVILVLGLLWGGHAYAATVLLECKDQDSSDSNEEWYRYYSLDIDKKKFELVAGTEVAKKCALGNCKKLNKFNLMLPIIYDEASYLSFGEEDNNRHTLNKKDLSMVVASYYMEEIGVYSNTFKKVNTLDNYSCQKINKFPF